MGVWGLIWQSYALPMQKFRSLVKVFWLPVFLLVIFTIVLEYAARHLTDLGAFGQEAKSSINSVGDIHKHPLLTTMFHALEVVFVLCFTIALVSSLVRWHLHLIKGKPPEGAQPWLQRGEWWFLWRWSWLGLVFVLLGVLVMLVGGCISFLVMGPEPILSLLNTNNPAVSPALVIGIWTCMYVLAMGFTGWLFPRTFLSLAAIAVGEGQQYRAVAKQMITRSDCFALALAILATTAPLPLFGYGVTLMMDWATPAALLPESIVSDVLVATFNFMAIFVFATMLSLFYREHVVFEAAVDQPPPAP
jgi:hypothetical protein